MKAAWQDKVTNVDGVPTITTETVKELSQGSTLVDVRRPDEWSGELGHIQDAKLVTLGPELEKFLADIDKTTNMIFICRSGMRSANATMYAQSIGFTSVANMAGGMMQWRAKGF